MAGSLESLIFGIRRIFANGVEMPLSSDINFTGATITNNEDENRLDIDLYGDIEKESIAVDEIVGLADASTVVVGGVTCAGGDIATSAVVCDGLVEATPAAGIGIALATGGFLSISVNASEIGRISKDATYPLKIAGTGAVLIDATGNAKLQASSTVDVVGNAVQLNGTIGCNIQHNGSIKLSTDSAGVLLDVLKKFGTNGIALHGTGSFGGGVAVLFIGNATTVPTTNPTGGGILYVEAGALKYRGSGGTVTPIAPA